MIHPRTLLLSVTKLLVSVLLVLLVAGVFVACENPSGSKESNSSTGDGIPESWNGQYALEILPAISMIEIAGGKISASDGTQLFPFPNEEEAYTYHYTLEKCWAQLSGEEYAAYTRDTDTGNIEYRIYDGTTLVYVPYDTDGNTPVGFENLSYRELVLAPGGTYVQKTTLDTIHDFVHTISPFEIGKYAVTYELWYTVRVWAKDTLGYNFANPGREGSHGEDGQAPTEARHEPVTNISWRDAIVWTNAYSHRDGRVPVYYAGDGLPIMDSDVPEDLQLESGSIDNPVVQWEMNGYRLPTVGEWQYAASWRGTNNTDRLDGEGVGLDGLLDYQQDDDTLWYWTPPNWASGARADVDDFDATDEVAWHNDGGSNQKTRAVGLKAPNHLGIFDMSGNTDEYCWDRQPTAAPVGPETNYRGIVDESVRDRTYRGGSWRWGMWGVNLINSQYFQIGLSQGGSPWSTSDDRGFRVARKSAP